MITDVPSGVVLRVQPTIPQRPLGPFPIEIFKYEPIPKVICWASAATAPPRTTDTFTTVSEKNPLCDQVRACLSGTTWNEIKMTNTAHNPLDCFQALPMCAGLGQPL